MNDKIKIFVSLHDDFFVADNELLEPIQVGCALTDKRIEGVLHDDEGDNISEKNKMYCELTAQYWAWKNRTDLDYYGFFHYRRYLSFNPIQLEHWENITYFDYCDDNAIKQLMLNEEVMKKLITSYDVIYPQENPIGGDTIYEHWCKHLVKKDLDILIEVIMQKYPDFYEITREVINSKEAIHCNMFIMRKEYFMDYNEWLFDILEECEKRIDFIDYSTEKLRTLGHMAERLCAIYSKYLEKKGAKICYVQRSLFKHNEKNTYIKIENDQAVIPVVLSCNNQYLKYTSVLLESILKNASAQYRYCVYIMHTDITKENIKIIEEQLGGVSNNNFEVQFIDVNRRMCGIKNLFVDRHLSIETYYRFLALDIFPKLDKILYLDCDTVVNDDIAKLYKTDIGNYSLGAVRDVDIISLYSNDCDADPEVRNNIDNNIKLNNYKDYFQAGVLILNLKKIRSCYKSSDIFEIATAKQWKFQDQDVLNHLFKEDVYYLPLKWNTLYECFNRLERVQNYTCKEMADEYKGAKMNPALIHYAGTPKPWENMSVDMGEYFWNYAKTSPFFEILIHDLNIMEFNRLKEEIEYKNVSQEIYSERDRLREEKEDLQWRLDETRKSFSYKLGFALTGFPRKLRELIKRN